MATVSAAAALAAATAFFVWMPPAAGQVELRTDATFSPQFSMRCSQLAMLKDCGAQFPEITVERIEITFATGNTQWRALCPAAIQEATSDTNRMLNYFENECPGGEAQSYGFRVPISAYVSAYSKRCNEDVSSLEIKTFKMTANIRCNANRPPQRPTVATSAEPAITFPQATDQPTTAQKIATPSTLSQLASSSSSASATTSATATSPTTLTASQQSPEATKPKDQVQSETTDPGGDRSSDSIRPESSSTSSTVSTTQLKLEIAGLTRDSFIAVMCASGLALLVTIVAGLVLMRRHSRKRRPEYLSHELGSRYLSQNGGGGGGGGGGGYYLRQLSGGKGEASIAAASTLGDINSVRNVRSPSLTPSLLVPVGADSLVSVNINGEDQSFVAVPVEVASRAISRSRSRGGSSVSATPDPFDAASLRSSAAASDASSYGGGGGGTPYRSVFVRRGSSSSSTAASEQTAAAAAAAADNGAFTFFGEWEGRQQPLPSRRARTATASSGGRLESIGEELSLNSEPVAKETMATGRRTSEWQRQQQRDFRLPALERSAAAVRRSSASSASATGASSARRMTLPAYYDASMMAAAATTTATAAEQRYSADGRSFTYEGSEAAADDADDHGGGEPQRWPYSTRMRLPRTSWTGGGLSPAAAGSSAFPATKKGWLTRPAARRQSAL